MGKQFHALGDHALQYLLFHLLGALLEKPLLEHHHGIILFFEFPRPSHRCNDCFGERPARLGIELLYQQIGQISQEVDKSLLRMHFTSPWTHCPIALIQRFFLVGSSIPITFL